MRLKLGEQVPNLHARGAVYTTKQEPFGESFLKSMRETQMQIQTTSLLCTERSQNSLLPINKMIRNTLHVQ